MVGGEHQVPARWVDSGGAGGNDERLLRLRMGTPQQKDGRDVSLCDGPHNVVGERLPSTPCMAGGFAFFNGEAGIEKKNALSGPVEEGAVAGCLVWGVTQPWIACNFLENIFQGGRGAYALWHRKRQPLRLTGPVVGVLSQYHDFDLGQGCELQGQKGLRWINGCAVGQPSTHELA